jgi:pimeloyl-ACP methyl ester carboxylesterase
MRTRVLYLHGLEENSTSKKPAELVRGDPSLDVLVPNLRIFHLASNGLVASACRVLAPVASASFLLSLFAFGSVGYAAAASATIACLSVALKSVRAQIFARSLDASYAVAHRAVAEFRPDVIVGFSWGGALALRLVEEGAWSGPLLLLGSAHRLLYRLAGRMPFCALTTSLPKRLTIVHGGADTLIPVSDSLELAEAANVKVDVVAMEPHKLWGVAPRLAALVRELVEAPR